MREKGLNIKSTSFLVVGEKTTVCTITLENGFEIVGTSACVDPKQFNVELGRKYANEEATHQLNAFLGFYKQQDDYKSNRVWIDGNKITSAVISGTTISADSIKTSILKPYEARFDTNG